MGKVFAAGIAAIFVKGLSAKPWFSGTVAEVGENGVRSRSVFNDGKWCGGRSPFCGNKSICSIGSKGMGTGPSERERLAKESAIEQAEQERQ